MTQSHVDNYNKNIIEKQENYTIQNNYGIKNEMNQIKLKNKYMKKLN